MDLPEEISDPVTPRRPWRTWLRRIGKIVLVVLLIAACRMGYQHHEATKKLDEARAELDRTDPGWRLEDIEAAREQIPDEENSARVVVAAYKLTPQGWPPREFEELFAHLSPNEQLDPNVFTRLKKELAKLEPSLTEARKLADMPRGRHRLVYERLVYETLLVDQEGVRRIAHLLFRDAMQHTQEGDMEHALISCRASFNAARSLGDEPIALSQIIRAACVMNACVALERALAHGEPEADALTALQHLLENEDNYPDLLTTMRGERAALNATFEALESGDVPLRKLAGINPNWKDDSIDWFGREKFREAHPTMLTAMSRFVDIARLPMQRQGAAEMTLDRDLYRLKESEPLAVLLIPALLKASEVSRRKHAYLRCMMIALAAERYRQQHKKWPDAINKLCPKYLTSVPSDPFDGQPLRFTRFDDGIVMYSVSYDDSDDSGNLDPANPLWNGVDIGYRLWDLAKRRQPPRPKPPNPE